MNAQLAKGCLLITLSFLFISCNKSKDATPPAPNVEWNYEDTDAWSSIAGNAECAGNAESPINIVTSLVKKVKLDTLYIHYVPSTFKVKDDGHTIQVIPDPQSLNFILINGVKSFVKQFHFHISSEHLIDGNSADMELHIVHQDSAGTDLEVLAIFLKQDTLNTDNAFIDQIWNLLPVLKKTPLDGQGTINMNSILPVNQKDYFQYTGSLTTPPCTQGVDWIVFRNPVRISQYQLSIFQGRYFNNHRPVKPLNHRTVVENF